ncbi:hypothetical protein SAMN05660485_02961, partial [Blastococcus fimeti]
MPAAGAVVGWVISTTRPLLTVALIRDASVLFALADVPSATRTFRVCDPAGSRGEVYT